VMRPVSWATSKAGALASSSHQVCRTWPRNSRSRYCCKSSLYVSMGQNMSLSWCPRFPPSPGKREEAQEHIPHAGANPGAVLQEITHAAIGAATHGHS
jgi:hypothetical protein